MGRFDRGNHLCLLDPIVGIQQVGPDRIVPDVDILADDGNISAQHLQRPLLEVETVEADIAGAQQIETHQQIEDSAFAAAARPNEGNIFARLHPEGKIGDALLAVVVVDKADLLKNNLTTVASIGPAW